jgi:hypothetical protein
MLSARFQALLSDAASPRPERAKTLRPSLLADESGATMVMGIFMAAMLVGMIYYVWGIGGAVVHRERLQDAADTAVFGAAVIEARGMNLIALLNVIMLALAVIATAMLVAKEIVMWTAIFATIDCLAKLGCCWATGCCIEPCIDAGRHWVDYNDIRGNANDMHDRFDSIVGTLNSVSNGIRRGAPSAAQYLVVRYGTSVYRPTTTAGLADIMPFVTTLAVENDPTDYACGDGSWWPGGGGPRGPFTFNQDIPSIFGFGVALGSAAFSAAATRTDGHYGLGLLVGGMIGWNMHRDEYCDGDPDSFMRVPEDDWLGEEPFQVRAGMTGAPPFGWTVQGVAVANWGRTEGTTSVLSAIPPSIANSTAIAQAEYYWESEDGDVKQEWMFSPRWRARLRRVSLRGIGGPLGVLLSGVGTVLDPLMIH